MKKLLAVCSFCLLIAGCAHQGAGYGSAGGFSAGPECIMDSAYSLGPIYSLGPAYGYAAAGGWDEGLCRNGGRRSHPRTSPEVTSAIAQRASVVGHTRPRPHPRVITRPETDTASGGSTGSAASSSVAQGSGSGSGFASAPSAPASPATAVSSPSAPSSPASQPAPHSD